MQKIYPCLWFDKQAEEAVKFYVSVFKDSKVGAILRYDEISSKPSGMPVGSVLTIGFKIAGQDFLGLNGGPMFKMNPSISFMIYCKDAKEVDALYKKLAAGGKVMMALGKYPFNERYAFIADKYGVSWQIMVGKSKQKIVPSMLFVGKKIAKGEEALNYYAKIFKKARITALVRPDHKEKLPKGFVRFSSFTLEGNDFSLMCGEGEHKFDFNEGVSLIVNCKDQKEVDYYWNSLTKNGGQESMCGWLKDKYGVSWQITPQNWDKIMMAKDQKKARRAMAAMMTMRKLDIAKLKKAFDGK